MINFLSLVWFSLKNSYFGYEYLICCFIIFMVYRLSRGLLEKMDLFPGTESQDRITKKRNDFIGWEDYFMSIACLVSKRSKDPSTQVGACIVNKKNRIVGQGYNGMPRGCDDNEFPWSKTSQNPLETKYFYVCHAEMNAIFNKNCEDISNCIIYTILFPCNQCAKTIIQSGISEVVYMCDKNMNKKEAIAALKMFEASEVRCRQFIPQCNGFLINFKKMICERSMLCSNDEDQRDHPKKLELSLPWNDYFLAIAVLVAQRSKCPTFQLGACVVNSDNLIIGQGYNGMPYGCSDDMFPWATDNADPLRNKYLYECHAELNAILNAGTKVKGCSLYTMVFPCNECAKAIIQTGIKKIIYIKHPGDEPEFEAARRMLDSAGVPYRQYTPKQEEIFVDLLEINWDRASQLPETPTKNIVRGPPIKEMGDVSLN